MLCNLDEGYGSLCLRAAAQKSVCIRKFLQQAISTQVFLVSLRLQGKSWDVSQVATACFSCSPPDLNLSKLNSMLWRPQNYLSKLFSSPLIQKIKIPRPLSQVTISNHSSVLTSLSPYQKDEGVEPGNIVTKWFSFSKGNKTFLTSAMIFHLHLLFYCYFFFSLIMIHKIYDLLWINRMFPLTTQANEQCSGPA
jgi:hypothetical protein